MLTLVPARSYHVRFDHRCSERTVLKFVTDGTLLRECLEDRSLQAYSAVILDEAHIRSMDTDILFGLLKTLLTEGGSGSGGNGIDGAGVSVGGGGGLATLPSRDGGGAVGADVDGLRRRPRIIIMSATLQSERLGEFFACDVFNIPGRVFPVTTRYDTML